MSSKAKNRFHIAIGVLVINIMVLTFVTVLLEHDRLSGGNGNTTVYTTRTGECYHISNCLSLSKSKHETTLEKAVQKGYEQCLYCDAPILKPEKEFSFNYVHYLIIVPFSAMCSYAASGEIFWIDTKNTVLAYLPHLGLSAFLSFLFDLII